VKFVPFIVSPLITSLPH